MSDAMQAFYYIAMIVVLVAVLPIYNYMKLKRALRLAEGRARQAESELARTVAALDAVEREALDRRMTGSHPLDTPPDFQTTLSTVDDKHHDDPYAIPLGWLEVEGERDLATVSMHGESPYKTNHALITAETDMGKDGWAFVALSTLCSRAKPDQVQTFLIDGKGPDAELWAGRAHNWRAPVASEDEVEGAVQALEVERARRMKVLKDHGVTKWEELPLIAGRPMMPLLVVYVNELKLLKKPLGTGLETWLEQELASARAAGIRYMLATQNATKMKTEWRSQIGLFVGGFQSSRHADEPNVGLSTEEIREQGALPPSEIPGPGYFTVRLRRQVVSVRASRVDLAERKAIIASLPAATVSSRSTGVLSSAWERAGSDFQSSSQSLQNSGSEGRTEDGKAEEGVSISRDEQRAEQMFAAQRERVVDAIRAGRTDGQILREVFEIESGRLYGPVKRHVIALRAESDSQVQSELVLSTT